MTIDLQGSDLYSPNPLVNGIDQGKEHCRASCFLSDDDGVTWIRAKNQIDLPMRGVMEGSVAEHPDCFQALSLRTQLRAVYLSHDQGESWSPAQTTGLKASESCTCLRRIPGTRNLVLFWKDSIYLPSFDPFRQARTGDGRRVI